MKLLLNTLKEPITAELPVKTRELFFQAFYSPNVWRKNCESTQQCIVRREQDFKRLEDNSPGTQVSEQVRAMMLLCLGGLDPKEQTSVLSSCNNTYKFERSHMLCPNAAGKPVHRRDYLGARQQGSTSQPHVRVQWRQTFSGKARQVLADDEPNYEDRDEDAYLDEGHEIEYDDSLVGDAYMGYSDDELMDALLSDFPDMTDPTVAEAFATVAQHRFKRKTFMPGKGASPNSSRGNPSFGFQARREMSFSEKAKGQRKSAEKFLKTVTPCTVCQQNGHWAGDPKCPVKKGKGRAARRRPLQPRRSVSLQRRKPLQPPCSPFMAVILMAKKPCCRTPNSPMMATSFRSATSLRTSTCLNPSRSLACPM